MRPWERFDGVVGAISLGGGVAPELAMNEPRSRLNRTVISGSIALQSRFDRTTIVDFFHESSQPSDGMSR